MYNAYFFLWRGHIIINCLFLNKLTNLNMFLHLRKKETHVHTYKQSEYIILKYI